ncbi:MAG: MFS transporter, partial [Verrucomicrobiota bacterium]|nr:MFS transporter [Verrucomicrobiota bacterium]
MPTCSRDFRLLFASRMLRLFAYGFLAVVLVLYLSAIGLSEARIGLLLTLTFLGDAAISLWLSTHADRWGRRRVLLVGAGLVMLGGAGMAVTENFLLLALAATVGVISPTGSEVGPFLAVEQACLAHVVNDQERTQVFAWYHVAGFTASALGAIAGGWLVHALQQAGWNSAAAYRVLFWAYAVVGAALAVIAWAFSPTVEVHAPGEHTGPIVSLLGLPTSRGIVLGLSGLFTVDAFAGGFIVQSFLAYWFHKKFGADIGTLGTIFFGTNLITGFSALAAVPLARRIGLVNTMVWTHLPSNVLLMVVPLMPTLAGAVAVLLTRHVISQMDVPTRQSYVNAIVPANERSAANGVTTTARQLGTSLAPLLAGPLLGSALANLAFYISGG